jgi:hypothetical protein
MGPLLAPTKEIIGTHLEDIGQTCEAWQSRLTLPTFILANIGLEKMGLLRHFFLRHFAPTPGDK